MKNSKGLSDEISSLLNWLRSQKISQKDIATYIADTKSVKGFSESYITLLKKTARTGEHTEKRKELLEYLQEIQGLAISGSFRLKLKGNNVLGPATNEKLAQYLDRQFYLYFFDTRTGEPCIGRAVMKIGAQADDVTIENVDHLETNYKGSVKLHQNSRYLIFDLFTETTNEKGSHIKVHRPPEKITPYTIGTFSNIMAGGSLSIGTLILELQPETEKLQPLRLYPGTSEYNETNINVIRFFKEKGENYIKLPAHAIYSDEDFIEFRLKNNSRNKRVQLGNRGIFLSIPMSDNEHYEGYRKLALSLEQFFSDTYQYQIYSAYTKFRSPNEWTPKGAGIAFDEVEESLNACDQFILIYPEKVATFSFVELGMAIALNKHILVLFKRFEDLPGIFMDLLSSERVRWTLYNDLQDIEYILKSTGDRLLKIKTNTAKYDE